MVWRSVLVIALVSTLGSAQDQADPYAAAFERFSAAPLETQAAVVGEITRRIQESEQPDLLPLLKLTEQARRELEVRPEEPCEYYDPKRYARGLVKRSLVDPNSNEAELARQTFRPEENVPHFYIHVHYDFGLRIGLSAPDEMLPDARLWNFLDGYWPDADVLLAWLEWRFDCSDKYVDLARHYSHCYCDLQARCFQQVTLYDAMASQEKLDLPDVDVIPYARNILRDRSFRSPIPPDARRQNLYRQIKEGFLPYFQHRTFVEEAAGLFLNPECWIRDAHEGVRKNLVYLFASEEQDVGRIRAFLERAKSRGGFMDATLQQVKEDQSWRRKQLNFVRSRNEARWEVARSAYAVLREYRYLKD